MDTPRKAFRRAVAALLVGPILALGQSAPATADVIGARGPSAVRARVERAVVDALVAHGVDATQAKARAAALSDAEAARIAKEIESLPAGGNPAIVAIIYAFAWVVAIGFLAVFKLVEAVVKEARK